MEVRLEKKSINYYKNLFNSIATHEETMEMIVPDALPDILGIVDTDGTVILRSKEAENGRATLGGVINATVLYMPEGESGICRLEMKIPFTTTYESMEIDSSTRLTASARLAAIDSRMMNPRKIMVRADVLTEMTGWVPESAEVYGCEETEDPNIEMLRGETEVKAVTDVREKTFVVSDELTLPTTGTQVKELLKTRFAIAAEDMKMVGSKLIIKGSVTTWILYREQDGELGSTEFTTVFSQISETDAADGNAEFSVSLMPTGVYFDLSGSMVTMELHAVAQITALTVIKLDYIADTYSTLYDPAVKRSDCNIAAVEKVNTMRETVRDTVETAVPVRKVLDVAAFAGKVMKKDADGGCLFEAPIMVTVLYISADGRVLSVTNRLKAECRTDFVCSAMWAVAMVCGEPYAAAAQDGIELRILVEFSIVQAREQAASTVSMISWDPAAVRDLSRLPSITLRRVEPNDTLWTLAKRYNSTVDMIAQSNILGDDGEITIGQLLIIPKKR